MKNNDHALTDAQANKRILALVKPEYMNKIPFFVRKHAIGETCKLIASEHGELYRLALNEETFTSEVKEQMRQVINGIFEERMKKHKML